MRLAIFSDIHGNPLALHHVLMDITRQGAVDGYWILGDLATLGYDPLMALRRVATLPNITCIRGNTDRELVTGEIELPSIEQARNDPQKLAKLIEFTAAFSWTWARLLDTHWIEWLAALPLEQRLTLPDGTRLLAVHASPGNDDDPGIVPTASDDEIAPLLAGCEADLLLVGHEHCQFERRVSGVHIINPGSVSNPVGSDTRAGYALLEADEKGYRISLHRVAYDAQAVLAELQRVRHPSLNYLTAYFEGRYVPRWEK